MEETKNISQIVLQRIKESGIKPIPRKIFNLKRVLFWSFVGIALIIGAVSFSVALSILFNNDWYLYNKLGFGFILKTLPYFWVICLLIFTVLGEYYYRKTLLGYRHRIATVVGMYIAITVISGSILNIIGVGETVEQTLFNNVPIYHIVTFDKNEIWSHPEQGLLTGKIVDIGDKVIKIVDRDNVIWSINIGNVDGSANLKVGEVIKIIGDKDSDIDDFFTANEIHL